jgi:catechol 2,3-dioxygenase-like lactoylglutathione lyase family enzyme
MPDGPVLNLVVLRCADVAKTRAFYEALGLTFVDEQHGDGPKHVSCALASLVLELYPATKANPADKVGLAFTVTDLSATITALANAGGVLRSPPTGSASSAVFVDPDGRRVEVCS